MKKIFLLVLVALAVTLTGCALPWQKTTPVACTMEAKLCSDGSSVGRTGPNCEFAACPTPKLCTDGSVCPVTSTSQLANPAAVNCEGKGGTSLVKYRGDGGQYAICYFEDNRACEEWAMFRGDCPVGGIKTTGFNTEAQRYCAWSGGSTFAVANAVCKFKDGSQCLAEAFYVGICQKGAITGSGKNNFSVGGNLTINKSVHYLTVRNYNSLSDSWVESGPFALKLTSESKCESASVKLTSCSNFKIPDTYSGVTIEGYMSGQEIIVSTLILVQ